MNSHVSYPLHGARNLARIEQSHFWFVARRALVRAQLFGALGTRDQNSLCLDIGCGTGYTAAWLTEQGLSTAGIDALETFKEFGFADRTAGLRQCDIFSVQIVERYDAVLLLDVLEHVENDAAFLARALEFLKVGGVAVITTPSFNWLWSPIDELSGHYRRYTKRSFKAMLREAGVNVSIVRSSYFFFTTLIPFLISRLLTRFRPTVESEAAPPNMLNSLFSYLLRLEARTVSVGGPPVGSSLFVMLRRLG